MSKSKRCARADSAGLRAVGNMGLDVEPIYSAEQIVVPPDLADVLKAYTKEVIRRQPDDILEFSVAYFANLVRPHRHESLYAASRVGCIYLALCHHAETVSLCPHTSLTQMLTRTHCRILLTWMTK